MTIMDISSVLRPDIYIPDVNFSDQAVDTLLPSNQQLMFHPALLEGQHNSGFKGLYQSWNVEDFTVCWLSKC